MDHAGRGLGGAQPGASTGCSGGEGHSALPAALIVFYISGELCCIITQQLPHVSWWKRQFSLFDFTLKSHATQRASPTDTQTLLAKRPAQTRRTHSAQMAGTHPRRFLNTSFSRRDGHLSVRT